MPPAPRRLRLGSHPGDSHGHRLLVSPAAHQERQRPSCPLASLYMGDLHPEVTEAVLSEKFPPPGPPDLSTCAATWPGPRWAAPTSPSSISRRGADTGHMNLEVFKGQLHCVAPARPRIWKVGCGQHLHEEPGGVH